MYVCAENLINRRVPRYHEYTLHNRVSFSVFIKLWEEIKSNVFQSGVFLLFILVF